VVESGAIAAYDRRRLIRLMIGRELEELSRADAGERSTRPMLRVTSLSVSTRVRDASLVVEKGEVVGLAGLVGAGRSALLNGIFGLEPTASGTVEIEGRPASRRGPLGAIGDGLGYVPADRKTLGLVQDMSVRENLLMARTCRLGRLRRPRRAAEQETVDDALERFRIVCDSPAAPVARLSGGNQQKVVLAKWLATRPKVLLLDEPTRGVDVGAKADIYRLLDGIKETGVGILVSSSETPELRLICDRILVMYRGGIAAALSREEATEARIAHYAMGHAT
jgi:L-arabinose transport system ATP-binding protein